MQGVVEDLSLFHHVLQLGLGAQGGGVKAFVVLVHHAHAVSHGDVVPGILAQLARLHAGPAQKGGDDRLHSQAVLTLALRAVVQVVAAQALLQRLLRDGGLRICVTLCCQGRSRQRETHRRGQGQGEQLF